MITDLGHSAFAAHDVDETIGFYGMLGIEEAFRLHHDDGSLMLVYLHLSGDRFIEVFPGGPSPGPDREQSFMHICLLTDDLHTPASCISKFLTRPPASRTTTLTWSQDGSVRSTSPTKREHSKRITSKSDGADT